MWQKQNLYPRKRYQLILNDFPLYYTKCVDILFYQDVPFHPLHGHALHGARRTGDDDDDDDDGLLGGGFSGLGFKHWLGSLCCVFGRIIYCHIAFLHPGCKWILANCKSNMIKMLGGYL